MLEPIYQRESTIASLEAEIGRSKVERLREDLVNQKLQLDNRHAQILDLESWVNGEHKKIDSHYSHAISALSVEASQASDPSLLSKLEASITELTTARKQIATSESQPISNIVETEGLSLGVKKSVRTSDKRLMSTIVITNQSHQAINLNGWKLTNNEGHEWLLDGNGVIAPRATILLHEKITGKIGGSEINLINPKGKISDTLVY